MGALCQSDGRQNPITPLPHYLGLHHWSATRNYSRWIIVKRRSCILSILELIGKEIIFPSSS